MEAASEPHAVFGGDAYAIAVTEESVVVMNLYDDETPDLVLPRAEVLEVVRAYRDLLA